MQEPARASDVEAALHSFPAFASIGPLFKSAEPLLLTEEETEYNIAVVVHVFPSHLLLQFDCTNTVAEQVLENVSVLVDLAEAVRAPQHLLVLPAGRSHLAGCTRKRDEGLCMR